MIVASWLLALNPAQTAVAIAALDRPGHQLRQEHGSRWLVLLTESDLGVSALRSQLLSTPGVLTADPIVSFDDQTPDHALVRWSVEAREACARPPAQP
jgi:hypothetical protein